MPDPVHIVCLGAPSPPDYGGGIDMFEKIKAVVQSGRKVILHYFEYERARGAGPLKQLCAAVHTYRRSGPLSFFTSSLPFIVSSRVNRELIRRLNEDDFDIILEGFHCAGVFPHVNRPRGNIVVRVHNDEAAYYHNLSLSAFSLLRKQYYKVETKRLIKFQHSLPTDTALACLSSSDMEVLTATYGFRNAQFIPCFTPWKSVESKVGKGVYCFYHGNLRVEENERAAMWLITNIFVDLPVPFVIAGRGVSERLKAAVVPYKHISIITDPTAEELETLVAGAHIHVLPSMNRTGVKLKLLHALFRGRFCITNAAGHAGSETKDAVTIAGEKKDWQDHIRRLMDMDFTREHIELRARSLASYDNTTNAEKLSALLSRRYR